MKILYAVQATGNGHISRAIQLMPFLEQYGEVDIFLSGNNCHLQSSLPVKYRSKGLSLFYGNKGGLDYLKMWKELSLKRIWNEAKDLPVEKYDLVINDFESITALACKLKKKKSIQFGHQASFQSALTPRPEKKELFGEMILKNYAPSSSYFGLHFSAYDKDIYNPIIKSEIVNCTPADKGHISVYLSHYSIAVMQQHFLKMKDIRFEVFSKEVQSTYTVNNITYCPLSNENFTQSVINSHGVITGAGFETPAEALYLGKKLFCLPIKGQYEQSCNAAALQQLGVTVIPSITQQFSQHIESWLNLPAVPSLHLQYDTYQIVQKVIEQGRSIMHTGENKLPNSSIWMPGSMDYAPLFSDTNN